MKREIMVILVLMLVMMLVVGLRLIFLELRGSLLHVVDGITEAEMDRAFGEPFYHGQMIVGQHRFGESVGRISDLAPWIRPEMTVILAEWRNYGEYIDCLFIPHQGRMECVWSERRAMDAEL